jgi:hypothetical protein
LSSGKDFGSIFRDLRADRIPYGEFDLIVFMPGFKRYRRRVMISERETLIHVVMQVSIEGHSKETLSGTIPPMSSAGEGLWISLFPLTGSPDNVIEAPVIKGYFFDEGSDRIFSSCRDSRREARCLA